MSTKIQWPMPAHWEDFEDMCYRLAVAEHTIVSGRKYGRRGQAQHGVDIVGMSDHATRPNVGIQCKLKTDHLGGELRADELRDAYEKSKTLERSLDKLYVVTTLARDKEISDLVDRINESWQRRHFLEVWCWEDICDMLEAHPKVAARYYPSLVKLEELQPTPRDPVELFIGAGSDAETSARLHKLFQHTAFRVQFQQDAQTVANVVIEHTLNCLHPRKGGARRVAIILDGTELTIEDDGNTFDPLDTNFVPSPGQMGLLTIRGLKGQRGLTPIYMPRSGDEANAFNRLAIRLSDRDSIASSSCRVYVEASHMYTRLDAHAYFEQMMIPTGCDPFTVNVGTIPFASSSGLHELVNRLQAYLVPRKLIVLVAPNRPDLYEALKGCADTWPTVKFLMS